MVSWWKKPRECETLEGGDVLPGFALPLADLFAFLDRVNEPQAESVKPISKNSKAAKKKRK